MTLLGKRIIFRIPEPEKENKTKSGIVLTKPELDTFVRAEVIAAGDEVKESLKKATYILVNRGGIDEFEWNKEKCHVIDQDMVLAME